MGFKARVAIIGAGQRCMSILNALYGEENIEIVGISDIDPSAPAVSLASSLNIFFTTDFHELINRNNINFIINATDSRDISRELELAREKNISVIDGNVSAFMLDILEKLKRDTTHLQEYLERQAGLYESLEHSREFLNKIIDTSADMIMVTNREGYITECNNAGERMLGYKRIELLGTRAAEYWQSPEDRRRVTERLTREERITNYETRLKRKDGGPFDISLSIALLRDDAGNIIGTVGISKDITDKKKYEAELTLLNERLEDKVIERTRELEAVNRELEKSNKLKSQFIANMSHELRTPLNSIIGFSESLLELPVGELNEKQGRYISRIYTSGKHLLQLINNLLDLAKIEAGRLTLAPEEFMLLPVLTDVISIIEALANKKEISIQYNTDERIAAIVADKVKFKQILYNLLSNAVKFTPEKGEIFIEVKLRTSSEGVLYGANRGSQKFIEVSVRDTGVGIRPEDTGRIFDEFEQVDSSYTKKYEGAGIGLSLTKKLVELHGGRIEVESRIDEGSTFTFIMPVFTTMREPVYEYEKTVKAAGAAEEFFTGEDRKNTILIVEDDLATSELLTDHLKGAGYYVAHSYDGEDAVRKAAKIKPFAIILDVMLPEKDGWEVLQDIRMLPETRDIPVIIYSVVDNKDLGFALGATDYIVKPVDKKTLLSRLNDLIAIKRKCRIVNIMVVDDNVDAVELLTSIFEKEGYNVIKAYGGREALGKAEEIRLDAIFLDLMMPDMDGFEVIQSLKSRPASCDIPIFILTAKDLTVEERLRLAGQIERVYQKADFSREDLIEQIKTLELMYPAKAGLIDNASRLFNQAYFHLRLAQEVKRANRYKEALSIVMLTIDSFDKYITEAGPYYGDLAIKKIAEILRKGLRGSDVIARLAPDEFALILTETVKTPSTIIARRFKAMIEGYPFHGAEVLPDGKLTVRLGVVAYPEDAASPEDLIFKATLALRSAKETGKSQLIE